MSGAPRTGLASLISNPYTYDNITGKILIDIGGANVDSIDNEGIGIELVDNTDPQNPKIRSLIAGTNINIINNGQDLTIHSVDSTPDINYSLIDTNNSNFDVYGLTKDITSNTRLLIDNGSLHLDYTDESLNSCRSSDAGFYIASQTVAQIKGITNTIVVNNNSTLDDNGVVLIENDNNDTNLTNNKIIIQNLPLPSINNSTIGSINMTNQNLTIQEINQLDSNLYSNLFMDENKTEIYTNSNTNSSFIRVEDDKITLSIDGINPPKIVFLGVQPTLSQNNPLTINPLTGNVSYGNADSINLIGNPIHQFVTGGTGSLDYRGMISPLNTISLNLTPTNLELDVNIPLAKNSSLRANVDPTTNPDPITNGLIIPMGSGQVDLPITIIPLGIGIADCYINDDDGDYTVGVNSVLFNNAGDFCVSFNLAVLGSVDKTSPLIAQILLNGQLIFTAPSVAADAKMGAADIGPFGPFTKAWLVGASANCQLNIGDELIIALLPNNPTDDNVVQVVSNISIQRIDQQAFQGLQGPPGAVNEVNNDGVASFNLVENPGANANIIIKGLQSGTGIDLFDFGTNIEVNLSAMQPLEMGGAFGLQNTGASINNFGYDNDCSITSGNCIAQNVANNLTGDKSNVMAAFFNLNGNNNIIDSNVFISSSGSELVSANNSNIIGKGFINGGNNYNNCNYIGDMTFTIPSNSSTCINSNVHGNNITMADDSAYFGSGFNNITLNTNEVHFDYNAPGLFYHDLTQDNTANVLYYDNSTSKITWDTIPASSVTLTNLGAGNNVLANPSTGNSFNFKTLVPGSNVTLTPTANDITINSTNGYNTGFSLYLTAALVNPPTTTTLPGTTTYTTSVSGVSAGFDNGSLINTSTGVITIDTTGPYIVNSFVAWENDGASTLTPDSFQLIFRDTTNNVNLLTSTNSIEQNDTNTYQINSVINLTATNTYEFRIVYSLTTGTQTLNSGSFSNFSLIRLY